MPVIATGLNCIAGALLSAGLEWYMPLV